MGSLPGTDIGEAIKMVLGELPDLPYLPELPERGPGADMIGRSAGLLVDLPVQLYAARWQFVGRAGRDMRRIADLRERDLDAWTEQATGYDGTFKVQVAGPWSMAASVELRTGGAALRDPGAVRDLAASLGEGLRRHVAELAARVPGARLLLQLDEPTLPAVLAGRVPTESGLNMLPAPDHAVAVETLRQVIDSAGVPVVVHCCAPDPPVTLLQQAGARAVAVDLNLLTQLDPIGEALEAGVGVFAGAFDARDRVRADAGQVADRVRRWWSELGFSAARLARQVVVTQACGLAGASLESARAVLGASRDAGKQLASG